MQKLKVLDLFAGAGGLSLGFKQTNAFEIIMAIEKDKHAASTYRRNNNIQVVEEDIRNLNYVNIDPSQSIDVIIGGPPCQGFSNANRQRNELISGNNQLVKEYVRAIKEISPKAFIMENVHSMASKKQKFFLVNDKYNDISTLGIEIYNEDILIGHAGEYAEKVYELLIDSICKNKQIYPFILSPDLTAKLNSLVRHYRKKNECARFFNHQKNRTFIEKQIRSWESLFYTYKPLQSLVTDSKSLLINCLNSNGDDQKLIANIVSLLEINQIFSRGKEAQEENIAVNDYKIYRKKIYISVQTYTVFEYLKATFSKLGYEIHYGTLNAAQFGVPQIRHRFIVIGVKKQFAQLPVVLPEPILQNPKDFFTIEHAIKDLEILTPTQDITSEPILKSLSQTPNILKKYLNSNTTMLCNHIYTKSRDITQQRFSQLKPGQNFHDLDEELKSTYSDTSRTQNTIYRRLDYNEPSPTVVNVRKSMWIHPSQDRAISIREAARLQSFPDYYIFEGPKDSQYQQVGNAVPPLLGRAVAEKTLNLLGYKVKESLSDLITMKNKENQVHRT
ncbi:DNA (cytosine-5)-methyltransferase 1 [Croceifilum oryzae]|uniref:Cytosine-specific methyltransferase n=1 Tax=Croceifilum oryzae TaxID=1553429 RepID=A0AAJ1TLY1_9BACL|nr:DNA cytosine methyltransferase [Croceifilum oryzae]MDQ0417090.1 DNA (cytosine-5)-methyltransferase 1 [Croceifilum oryzae]